MLFDGTHAVFVTAMGTPLDDNGDLVEESFRAHLRDQVDRGGADGVLVLGTMGMLASLKDSVCPQAARAAVEEVGDRAKVMVGVGDNSLERTFVRIEALKGLALDAVVATTPYYFGSSQDDLVYYYTKIADASPFPLYLYDLPQATKVKTELETMEKLSAHRNIHGAKCSHDPVFVRRLYDRLNGPDFEIIHAQYDLIDVLMIYGMTKALDGFFGVMAPWIADIKRAYDTRDFGAISRIQKRMTALRCSFLPLGVFPAFTVAMNLLGFEGRFHPSHMRPLDDPGRDAVRRLLEDAGLL